MSIPCDRIWRDARLATLAAQQPGLGLVEDGLIATRDGRILFAGPRADAPAGLEAPEIHRLDGRWITPALIDCHTHLVYGGDRAAEFAQRLAGATYEQIARAGGGILATVRATRQASPEALRTAALRRLDALLAEGVGTVEIKSGYGLDLATELKQLRVARELASLRPVEIATTFLGAHTLPPEYREDRAGYLDLVCGPMLRQAAAAGLADAVDAFCEAIAFTPEETARVFTAARAAGLRVKLHADQLGNSHGAALAARFDALSADHLEYCDAEGVAALKQAGSVAVLLPGAFYTLRETHRPPVELLRRAGVPIALATDHNPGTSPLTSPLWTMNLAATLFRMTVEECLIGMTRAAARALGRLERLGTLEAGKCCDLAIWEIEQPAELVYRMGFNPLSRRVWRGR